MGGFKVSYFLLQNFTTGGGKYILFAPSEIVDNVTRVFTHNSNVLIIVHWPDNLASIAIFTYVHCF